MYYNVLIISIIQFINWKIFKALLFYITLIINTIQFSENLNDINSVPHPSPVTVK